MKWKISDDGEESQQNGLQLWHCKVELTEELIFAQLS